MAEEVQVALPVLRASSVLFPRRMMLNTVNSLLVSKKQYLSSGPILKFAPPIVAIAAVLKPASI